MTNLIDLELLTKERTPSSIQCHSERSRWSRITSTTLHMFHVCECAGEAGNPQRPIFVDGDVIHDTILAMKSGIKRCFFETVVRTSSQYISHYK